jgi:hypothetical protein
MRLSRMSTYRRISRSPVVPSVTDPFPQLGLGHTKKTAVFRIVDLVAPDESSDLLIGEKELVSLGSATRWTIPLRSTGKRDRSEGWVLSNPCHTDHEDSPIRLEPHA